MRTSLIAGFVGTLLFGGAIGYFFGYDHGHVRTTEKTVSSFEECKDAGYPILEKYPEECRTPEGKTFTRHIEEEPSNPDTPVESPPSSGGSPYRPLPIEPVACTMDAKICPDGSYVGRQGPNCEFAPCPGE